MQKVDGIEAGLARNGGMKRPGRAMQNLPANVCKIETHEYKNRRIFVKKVGCRMNVKSTTELTLDANK